MYFSSRVAAFELTNPMLPYVHTGFVMKFDSTGNNLFKESSSYMPLDWMTETHNFITRKL